MGDLEFEFRRRRQSGDRGKLISRNNLASAYRAVGDLARAIPLYEATLADSERVLGPDHPTTQIVRSNLDRPRTT
ncbi:hypothetical protein SD37_11880 [Amycolatopsis orientalis]|uniref:Tetratricopeptide repeat protein n=1 Tax=Amycolatopsis orientalis TaxID=31958 RepID=A0A193BVT1_AMYOR|nr:tetratricopeptide repeat protein [Amycolatopsis orientalis]ANN16278.1 hypothetical protein SD37_11880 [Amycolatopsis orientalis]